MIYHSVSAKTRCCVALWPQERASSLTVPPTQPKSPKHPSLPGLLHLGLLPDGEQATKQVTLRSGKGNTKQQPLHIPKLSDIAANSVATANFSAGFYVFGQQHSHSLSSIPVAPRTTEQHFKSSPLTQSFQRCLPRLKRLHVKPSLYYQIQTMIAGAAIEAGSRAETGNSAAGAGTGAGAGSRTDTKGIARAGARAEAESSAGARARAETGNTGAKTTRSTGAAAWWSATETAVAPNLPAAQSRTCPPSSKFRRSCGARAAVFTSGGWSRD
jgi:hypothetical protein